MSFTAAIYTSMSALNAEGAGISTVGNNLANISTDGFKDARTQFEAVLSSVLGEAPPDSIGSGVAIQAVTAQFTDGPIVQTTNPLDMAITGAGFFQVDEASRNDAISYTRDGTFSLDKNGNIVDPKGDILQGYLADASGNIGGAITNLDLSGAMTSSYNGVTGGLTGFTVSQDGTIQGTYDNGQQKVLAQVPLIKFNAPTGLANEGDNLLAATDASGAGTALKPGKGGAGAITGNAVEGSNVNENTEFGTMISLQEAFQVNSQAMQAADTEYTNICNMTI